MHKVAVIMGSSNDEHIASEAVDVLRASDVKYDVRVLSAHRDLEGLKDYVQNSDAQVFIAIAGLSAALPGVVASMTEKPVIGVPVSVKLGGLDALLSIAQMPPKVPVACVGIDNGKNAAYLAIRMLRLAEVMAGSPHP
ncbi:MAG: 5-(carboxyamino)imidazole ribonucleotide mutase [Methermicoccaceae archaeon]